MSKLSIAPSSHADAKIADYLERFTRRTEATPPGMCPVSVQLSLLETGGAQTCGKCVPCRDGIPALAKLLAQVRDCEAAPEVLDEIRELATLVRDGSDCAIGYEAGNAILEGLETFADEYESHVAGHHCLDDVAQKVPCESLCPAHVDVPGYISLVGEGRYAEAVQLIRKDNPFPTMCALVCEHPCEVRCRRQLIDAPVNIRGIKRFAVDMAPADTVSVPKRLPDTGKHIAVVGAGPSGLTCAYYLALMGHKVTVFEGRSKMGGMTRYGIPAYRFPRELLDRDIKAVLSVGNIDVKLNTLLSKEDEAQIIAEHDAVYVAVGAQIGKRLRLDGIDAKGVISAVDLLSQIGDDEYPDFTGKKVAVIGGGNVAMDCCRTAVRLGASEVTCVYRRRIEDMTALYSEIESAMQEGVEMMTLQAPARIETDEDNNCVALITQPQYISAVKRGRPAPATADKPEVRVEADIVLVAVGQDIMSTRNGMPASSRKPYKADEFLKAEGYENVFVGGDCQTGPATVIRAIGAGKVAARNIDDFLGYNHTLDCGVVAPPAKENDRTPYGRVNITERPARERKKDFLGVECDMSLEEAKQECGRCLRCDHYGCGVLEDGRHQYV
ncbi:MAG: NAD(P)-binding protein [Coriobacteriia bacterium]|nr:NAD(P)-binding protein [Coriobacteriia bacterium]